MILVNKYDSTTTNYDFTINAIDNGINNVLGD